MPLHPPSLPATHDPSKTLSDSVPTPLAASRERASDGTPGPVPYRGRHAAGAAHEPVPSPSQPPWHVSPASVFPLPLSRAAEERAVSKGKGFLASLRTLQAGPTTGQTRETAEKQARLRADLAAQVAERKSAAAAQKARLRELEAREEEEIRAYHARQRAEPPPATAVPGPARSESASDPPHPGARRSVDGEPTPQLRAVSWAASAASHRAREGSQGARGVEREGPPHPAVATGMGASQPATADPRAPDLGFGGAGPAGQPISSPLLALLNGIQAQQQSLQEGLAAQAASVDRLELALLSARRPVFQRVCVCVCFGGGG